MSKPVLLLKSEKSFFSYAFSYLIYFPHFVYDQLRY
jgi:hypothetical protein